MSYTYEVLGNPLPIEMDQGEFDLLTGALGYFSNILTIPEDAQIEWRFHTKEQADFIIAHAGGCARAYMVKGVQGIQGIRSIVLAMLGDTPGSDSLLLATEIHRRAVIKATEPIPQGDYEAMEALSKEFGNYEEAIQSLRDAKERLASLHRSAGTHIQLLQRPLEHESFSKILSLRKIVRFMAGKAVMVAFPEIEWTFLPDTLTEPFHIYQSHGPQAPPLCHAVGKVGEILFNLHLMPYYEWDLTVEYLSESNYRDSCLDSLREKFTQHLADETVTLEAEIEESKRMLDAKYSLAHLFQTYTQQ